MKFVPNSSLKKEMLEEINLKNIDELFSDIPKKIMVDSLKLNDGLSQQETEKKLRAISCMNKPVLSFMGGGIKSHYVPAVVKGVTSRAEFYSAYTPYQSEASQGFLQAMFEYQSLICEITDMDVANASLYDGATALGEAAMMCARINKKRNKFVIPSNISWEKKSVLKNYNTGLDLEIVEVPFDKKTGKIDLRKLEKTVDKDTAGVYVENPNFFGVFEDDIEEVRGLTGEVGSLMVAGVDPLSLGVVKSPGEYDADIVIGEGRCLGLPMDFGGSGLGFFACKKDFLRRMPGRVIGLTEDVNGKRAFCMTLQTREQHIRRGRATSNICTNEGLCALSAVVYLSWLGGNGLHKLGCENFEKGQKLAGMLSKLDGFDMKFKDSVHFNEFVMSFDGDPSSLNKKLLEHGIQGGLLIDEYYPGVKNCLLFGVTELIDDQDMKKLVETLKEVGR